MRKSVISILMICVMAFGLLAGCGSSEKVTAESLLKASQKKTEDAKSLESHMTMSLTLDMGDAGGTMDMTMDADMQTMMDPIATYMNGTIGMMGMSFDMESYSVVEDDQLVNYIGMMNTWMVQKTDYDAEAAEGLTTAESGLLSDIDSLTLNEETEDVNGTEAYIISGTVSGEDIQNVLSSAETVLGDIMGEDSGMDLADVSVDFKYAISKADNTPLYMDMTFNDFTLSIDDMDIAYKDFTVKMEYTGFDTVSSIEVPQDVIDSAEDISE